MNPHVEVRNLTLLVGGAIAIGLVMILGLYLVYRSIRLAL
jgi:hypothetical protein